MTSTSSTEDTTRTPPRPAAGAGLADGGDRGALLADVLSANALFSATTGIVLVAGAWALDDVLGITVTLLVLLGLGLVGFAAAILTALARGRELRPVGRTVLVADLLWVAGAAGLLLAAPDALTSTGRWTLGIVTLVVVEMVAAEVIAFRRAGRGPAPGVRQVEVRASRVIDASVARVWAAVADVGGYARFAPGIEETTVLHGDGEGMVRRCVDERGDHWTETCTVWDEHRRYRMTVDTSTYPAHYRAVLHRFAMEWRLEPVGASRTATTLRFHGEVRLGLVGRLAIALMGRGDPVAAILAAYDRHLTAPR